MDKEGVPLDMSTFGSVYIKYMSAGGTEFNPGDAMLNGYDGTYRGIYFTPCLPDGEFRQYAVFPLTLFSDSENPAAGAPGLTTGLTVQVSSNVLLAPGCNLI